MSTSHLWRSSQDPERVMQGDIWHWQGEQTTQRTELLATEEPLAIQLNHCQLATIMRTPGHDFELTAGFLLSENIIQQPDELLTIEYAQDNDGLPQPNVVNVDLRKTPLSNDTSSAALFERRFTISSSCGLCGKTSVNDVLSVASPLAVNGPSIKAATLYTLTAQIREQQAVFQSTGGLHAAALFSFDGKMILLREDIGRHNAIDKLTGYGILNGLFPHQDSILLVSGRASFEIIQKALLARIPCIAAISAPSSLAVELADRAGITLVGFLREHTMNVYTHPQRIA